MKVIIPLVCLLALYLQGCNNETRVTIEQEAIKQTELALKADQLKQQRLQLPFEPLINKTIKNVLVGADEQTIILLFSDNTSMQLSSTGITTVYSDKRQILQLEDPTPAQTQK